MYSSEDAAEASITNTTVPIITNVTSETNNIESSKGCAGDKLIKY